MKNLLCALLVVGMLPALGFADPYFGSATEQEIADAKEKLAKAGEAAARRAREAKERGQRAVGAKFDWNRDAALIQGTDTEPLADWSWCDSLLEAKHRGKGFCMGALSSDLPYYKPVHKVELSSFRMAKTEVTVAQYRACVRAGGCKKPEARSKSKYCNWADEPGDRENHPVNCVDYNQAKAFAAWIGGRLPTEAEWEFAATSRGKNRRYPWGDPGATCERAVMFGNGDDGCGSGSTQPVGSKPAGNTDQRLSDMAGNVWEWVADFWSDKYQPEAVKNPKGPAAGSYRVTRGGSFNYSDGVAGFLRADFRYLGAPGDHYDIVGFRPVRDLSR